jgi:tRNA dimethylallyltransferase
VAEPNYKFTVADYLGCVNLVTEDIWRRGKLPIMAGGTGFYIKAAVDGIETLGVPPDWELRKQLSNLEIKKLRRILEGICPERLRGMNKSDRQNPRRLIRAIEIAQKRFMKPVSMRSNTKTKPDILFIGLTAPYRILYSRIDERVRERVRQGVEEEIKTLLKTGYSWKNSVLKMTIGYRQWQNYFNHEGTKEEAIKSWQLAEHGYTRRQMTWFKKDKRIEWFDISSKNWPPKLETLVGKWYNG